MKPLLTILAALLLVSCSVKKRTYRDGYYIDWAFHKKGKIESKKTERINNTDPVIKHDEPVEVVLVKSENNLNTSIVDGAKKTTLLMDTCGDVITFKSGDQVTVRVTEITDDKIKYKRCDNLDGPVFVVNKSTVATVKYANGVVEKIEAPVQQQPYTTSTNSSGNDKYYGPQKVHPLAGWSLVALLIGFFTGFGILASLILSIYAIKEITKNPKKWKGLTLAKVVKVISLIFIIFVGLIIIILLGSL